jgi:hypothetical protein
MLGNHDPILLDTLMRTPNPRPQVKNKVTLAALLLFAAISCANAQAAPAADEPIAVLDRFLGRWQTHTQIHRSGPPPRDFDTRGRGECIRTLDGRFVEFRTESIPPGDSDLQVMTYDQNASVYRQWLFSSDGYTHVATGHWDAATSTLRWEGKSGEETFEIIDRWVSPDRLEWTLKRTDQSGKVLQTIQGSLVREK